MLINNIINMEDKNEDKIYIFKASITYKAYERSAYRLSALLPEIRAIKRNIKKLGIDVACIFIDKSVFEFFTSSLEKIEENYEYIAFKCPNVPYSEKTYSKWREELPLKGKNSKGKENQIIDAINQFDLLNSSPMDAFNLIKTLKTLTRSKQYIR